MARAARFKVRKGQAPPRLTRAEFRTRFGNEFADPAFHRAGDALANITAVAWENYHEGRKAPLTRKAGKGFADPHYEVSIEWLETRRRLRAAEAIQRKPETRSRVLVICGAPRNDGSCPGEISKTFRLAQLASKVLDDAHVETDLLDLSVLTSEYGRRIHPCKGCVSTAMPLCHWPCSCYPNHSLGQTNDWMAEIYERWTAAHGVLIVTPVHWYQVPSVLKLMIDRLVCADGGNPDVTTTSGKDAQKAKALELSGWPFPKHLAGRVFGVIVHGDVAGTERVRLALTDWLEWMGLVSAGHQAELDRYIGYYEPYATSHEALDRDKSVQEEVRGVARALADGVRRLRKGLMPPVDRLAPGPRPK